uniref:Uncharacterized protein n=1 Tax=Panagrolaimus superbus TaxID=310955 RepID=A0A914XXS1_9BILA
MITASSGTGFEISPIGVRETFVNGLSLEYTFFRPEFCFIGDVAPRKSRGERFDNCRRKAGMKGLRDGVTEADRGCPNFGSKSGIVDERR